MSDINTKLCKSCQTEKSINNYSKNKNKKDGLSDRCKECHNIYKKEYRQKNKEKIKDYNRKYYKTDKGQEIEKRKRDKPHRKESRSKYNHSDHGIQKNKEYRLSAKGRESHRLASKRHYEKNPLKHRIANVVKDALQIRSRSKAIFEVLGYTIDDLRCHLESKFSEGMSLDNYGEWHIDHIIPQSWLPFESLEDENFLKCWSLCNLQPLWAKDNCSKGNRYAG